MRHFPTPDRVRHFLQGYYLATPLFVAADLVLGLNIRLTLPWPVSPGWYLYYLGCFAIGYLLLRGSLLGNLLALLESAANICLLLLSVMLPIVRVEPEAGTTALGIADGQALIQFVLVGTVFAVAFYRNPLVARRD